MKTNDKITTRLNQLAGVTEPKGRNEIRPEYFSNEVQQFEAKLRDILVAGWRAQTKTPSFRQYVVNQYLTTKQ